MRFWSVVGRGALYGLAGILVLVAAVFCNDQNDGRGGVLMVAMGLSYLGGPLCLLFGALMWWTGDGGEPWSRRREVKAANRGKSWHPYGGTNNTVETLLSPLLLRVGAAGVVLALPVFLLDHLIESAPVNSWLYGCAGPCFH